MLMKTKKQKANWKESSNPFYTNLIKNAATFPECDGASLKVISCVTPTGTSKAHKCLIQTFAEATFLRPESGQFAPRLGVISFGFF